MSDDLSQELRAFEGSEALANGDFSVCIRGADRIEAQAVRIAELEATLIKVDRGAYQMGLYTGKKTQAARIAKLEAALEKAADTLHDAGCHDAWAAARATLEGGKDE